MLGKAAAAASPSRSTLAHSAPKSGQYGEYSDAEGFFDQCGLSQLRQPQVVSRYRVYQRR